MGGQGFGALAVRDVAAHLGLLARRSCHLRWPHPPHDQAWPFHRGRRGGRRRGQQDGGGRLSKTAFLTEPRKAFVVVCSGSPARPFGSGACCPAGRRSFAPVAAIVAASPPLDVRVRCFAAKNPKLSC